MIRAWFARNRERLAVWLVAVLVVAASVGVFLLVPYPVDERAIDAVAEDPSLAVEETDAGVVVRPADGPAPTGLILYPGALVPTEAYVPLAGDLARETDLAVFLVDVPLQLAILDTDAASAVVDANPDVERWYVGGHSLGGAMACRYAAGNADELAGVVLLGAYCEADVSETDLDVLTVVGTRDGIVNRDAVERSRDLVPVDARFVAVEGMNHTQVGVYYGQADTDGTVANGVARRQVSDAVGAWLENGTQTVDSVGSRQSPWTASTRTANTSAAVPNSAPSLGTPSSAAAQNPAPPSAAGVA